MTGIAPVYILSHMTALAMGIVIDVIIGDPHNIPHPIRWIGRLIASCEKLLYGKDRSRTARFMAGAFLWLIVCAVTLFLTASVMAASYHSGLIIGTVVEAILTAYTLAAGSLRDESMAVYHKLCDNDLEGARQRLSMIVGRDTKVLDEAGVTRAAVETVAENTSDGVIAPLIYLALFGPCGGLVYKAVNTMDSMIGYRNERYEYFGRFAARMDDIANFIPSRISAVFMIAAAYVLALFRSKVNPKGAARIWWRDRYKHKSPNSAQTESVCAGALSLLLGGDGTYSGVLVKKPYIGDDTRPIEAEDIRRAVKLMFATEAVCTAAIFILIILISTFR